MIRKSPMQAKLSDAKPSEMKLSEAIKSLERTPGVLNLMLRGLPEKSVHTNEGDKTFSCYDVVGHLIHAENTDWLPRIRIILEQGEKQTFTPFDRFAMFNENAKQPIQKLLARFEKLRSQNLTALRALRLKPDSLKLTGRHPDLGIVTLGELISCWVVHDFSHTSQICRVLAKQRDVGPWKAYMSILNK
jgi:hypothetical protein